MLGPIHFDLAAFLGLGPSFFTARVFLVWVLVTYTLNISGDCSIREYRSIFATITGHQPMAQRVILLLI